MRVNIDSKALKDPRVRKLGRGLGIDWHFAIGLCLEVWMYAYEQRSEFLTAEDVDAVVDREGFGLAMLAADLAELDGDRLRLRGVRKRIGYLVNQQERGRVGGMASAAKRAIKKTAMLEPKAQAYGQANGQRPLKRDPSALDQDLVPDLALDQDQPQQRATPAPDPGVKPATDHFSSSYEKAYGAKYGWDKKQAVQIANLVRTHGLDEVKERTSRMFSGGLDWPAPPYTVGTLVSHWNRIVKPGVTADGIRRMKSLGGPVTLRIKASDDDMPPLPPLWPPTTEVKP